MSTPANAYRARIRLPETQEQIGDCGFSAAKLAHQSRDRALGSMKGDVLHSFFIVVGKRDRFEGKTEIRWLGVARPRGQGLFMEYVGNALHSSQGEAEFCQKRAKEL